MGVSDNVVGSGPTQLESDLRASAYQQLAISLVTALIKHGSHNAGCSYDPCDCGWSSEVQALIARARAHGLKLVKGGRNEAA